MPCLPTIYPSSKPVGSLKKKRFARNITDNVATTLPQRNVVRVISALPDRLMAKKESESNPQQLLESILARNGITATLYSFDQIPQLFEEAHQGDAWDFDVLKAVRQGALEELRKFHESGRTLECSNKFGETLLHLACRKALVPVVDFLINKVGVPVNVHDDMGRTPLHDAFWTTEPNTELIDLIVSKCPDLLFVKDKRGHSPLAYARRTHWGQWNKYVNSRSDSLEPALLKAPRPTS
jgi:hypothetical protein